MMTVRFQPPEQKDVAIRMTATEFYELASQAAQGAGVAPAESYRFASAALRHLADDRDAIHLADALDDPRIIRENSRLVGDAVEAASLAQPQFRVQRSDLPDPALFLSFLRAIPCAVTLVDRNDGEAWVIAANLSHPNPLERPADVDVPDALHEQMRRLADAAQTGAQGDQDRRGAGAMISDDPNGSRGYATPAR